MATTSQRTTHPLPCQFSLRSLILLVVYAAFVLAWLRWFWTARGWTTFYPGPWGTCFAGLLLVAGFQLRDASGCASAWNFIALAWFAAVGSVFDGISRGFEVLSTSDAVPHPLDFQANIHAAIVSGITLQLILSIPCLQILLFHYGSRPEAAARWIYGSLAIALLDVVLFIWLTSSTFGTWHA